LDGLVDWIWDLCCKSCGTAFEVCRCCYTGQRYCSEDCRERGRAEQLCRAQRQYAQTDKGQQALARATAKYRARSKEAPGEDSAAQPRGGDDETARPGVLVAGFTVVAAQCANSAEDSDTGWLAVVAAPWLPVPGAERCEPREPKRQLAVASWAETVHWLRFVIDQTLTGAVDGHYFGVRRGRCQICGHEGPLVRPVQAANRTR
jgi:hypothetical protein